MKPNKNNTEKVLPPISGMTKIPDGYGTPEWDIVLGSAWIGLCQWLLSQDDAVNSFKADTGHDLRSLVARNAIQKMIDDACGRENAIMAAWCDWVTVYCWGELSQ